MRIRNKLLIYTYKQAEFINNAYEQLCNNYSIDFNSMYIACEVSWNFKANSFWSSCTCNSEQREVYERSQESYQTETLKLRSDRDDALRETATLQSKLEESQVGVHCQ